jgi:uncharacterized membrane protein
MRGLAFLLPSILTVWILWTASVFVYRNVAEPINRSIRTGVIRLMPLVDPRHHPDWYVVTDAELADARAGLTEGGALRGQAVATVRSELRSRAFAKRWAEDWYLQGTGLLVAILMLYVAGALVGGLLGHELATRAERVIARIPGFKQVYPHVKQLVDLVIGERTTAFKRVVLVQFPREGTWVIAFVTGPAMKPAAAVAGKPCVTVFVPTTPTPFTGFTLTVPESDVVDLPISLDEAIRFMITGGVLTPERLLTRVEPGLPAGEAAVPGPTHGAGAGAGRSEPARPAAGV